MLTVIAVAALLSPRQASWVTPEEQRQGFFALTLDRWRGWRQATFPPAWSLEGEVLTVKPGKPGGDLATIDQFVSFDFRWDWKISEGGNSGVMYRCNEQFDESWESGPEYQLLDNEHHGDGKNPKTSAGSAYALYPPTQNVCHPAGQWNASRILVKGNHVEHWLNGVKVVDYVLNSEDWRAMMHRSKFNSMPHYGQELVGHIVVQDHGYPAEFRNFRIKRL